MAKEKTAERFLPSHFHIEPLSQENWDKFALLFGDKGACGNCWCMYFRLTRTGFEEGKRAGGNKQAMKKLVESAEPTGLIGFYNGQAIAWCAFAPREDFIKLEKSRIHKRIDGEAVWSLPCFFIDKKFRGRGISVELLKAVIHYAKEKGIKIVEAYPTIPTTDKLPDAFAWIGLYKSFQRAGLKVVDQKSKNRPMVRYFTE